MIEVAVKYQKPVRIGVNWGSLDQALADPHDGREFQACRTEGRARSDHGSDGRERAEFGEIWRKQYGLRADQIILSAKVSGVQDLIDVYRASGGALRISAAPRTDRSRHGREGHRRIERRAGACCCRKASATRFAFRSRLRRAAIARKKSAWRSRFLQSLGIRSFTPQVTACPGCGRTTSTFFQEMAEQIQTYLRDQMPGWKDRYIGVEEMKVAVMGCVVNGPGESKHANLGISLPGTFEEPKAPVYVDGRLIHHA